MDSEAAARKSLLQAHQSALAAAGALSDDTARAAAVKKANEDMRTAMQTAMSAQKDKNKTAMDAVKAACGDSMGPRGMGMMMKDRMGAPGMMMGRGHRGGWMHGKGPDNDNDQDQTSSTGTNQQ
jgi:hypothetical protein